MHEHQHEHGRDRHGNPDDLREYIARLEDPSRLEWQRPDDVVRALGLKRGSVVAEIGSGTGYMSVRLARKVGRTGRVFAVDVEPRLLTLVRDRLTSDRVPWITPVLGLPDDPLLPGESCDRILMVNAYHHLPDRPRALRRMARLLRRGGRIALIDFHDRELPVGPPPDHKVSRETALREVTRAGLKLERELDFLPYQYFLIIRA